MIHDTTFFANSKRVELIDFQRTSIHNLFTTYLLEVPKYQRGYDWELDNIVDIGDDVFRLYMTDMDGNGQGASTHFLTTIMLQRKAVKGRTVHELVDGQQRITTLYLFLSVLRAQTFLADEDDRAVQKVRADIDRILYSEDSLMRAYQTNDMSAVEPRLQHNLVGDRKAFAALCRHDVQTAIPHNATMAQAYQNIEKTVRGFYEKATGKKLRRNQGPSAAFLNNMFSTVTNGLYVGAIISSDEIEAQRAYIDINSKGKPLQTLDLVKARFASAVEEAAFNTAWDKVVTHLKHHKADEFLFHWMKARAKIAVSKSNLHKSFVRVANAEGGIAINLATLDCMAEDAQRYDAHQRGETINGKRIDGLYWATKAKLSQHRPLLLAAHRLERDMPALFSRLCDEIARLALAYSAAGEPTNQLSQHWEDWTRQIVEVKTKSELEVFLDNGIRRMRQDIAPKIEQGFLALGDEIKWENGRPKHNPRQSLLLSYFAYHLEHLRTNAKGAEEFDTCQTIEHIIPVSAIASYAGDLTKEEFRKKAASLGNLTLLTREENSRAGTLPVAQKLPIYATSAVVLSQASVHAVAGSKNGRTAVMMRILPAITETFGMQDVDNRTASLAAAIGQLLQESVE